MQRAVTPFDRVVLLGFGGPESAQEIRPFLDRVLEGRNVPRARYEAVVSNYELIGGKSPFNELTRRQAHALQTELHARGHDIPVEVAYLYAAPFARDLAARLDANELRRTVAVILSAFQSAASWERYQLLNGARYTPPLAKNEGYAHAYVQCLAEALAKLDAADFSGVAVIFTAHSIPQSMTDASLYASQFMETAERIAHLAGAPDWTAAYQSRSGQPADPWLEPDVREVLKQLPGRGIGKAIVAPIGFLCDHVEVLYDLDLEAAAIARAGGAALQRAATVGAHPLFIRMIAELLRSA